MAYKTHHIPALGSLNLDANASTIGANEFTEILNLRMSNAGEYEQRTGYALYSPSAYTPIARLLCTAEYRYKNIIFDVKVVWQNNQVQVVLHNKSKIAGSALWATSNTSRTMTPIIVGSVTTEPEAFAVQDQGLIAITVYGQGTYAFYPTGTADSATHFDTWAVYSLGAQVCPTPYKINYLDDTQNDLIVFQFDGAYEAGNDSEFERHVFKPLANVGIKKTEIEPPYFATRVPCGAKYFRITNGGFPGFGLKYWQWNKNDPLLSPPTKNESRAHLQTRAWGYRFVFIKKVSDGRGGEILYRSQPSADVWVPNNFYSPPVPYRNSAERVDQMITVPSDGPSEPWWDWCNFPFDAGADEWKAFPNSAEMEKLGNALMKFQNLDVTVSDGPVEGDPSIFAYLFYANVYTGYRHVLDDKVGTRTDFNDGETPYWCQVPASYLAEAPLTKFTWNSFKYAADGTTLRLDSSVVEIEVYRTAFSDGDADTTNGDPLFQPHLYGYVGSVKPDSDFTDDIKDSAIDFAKSPDRYEGYGEGQFSGKVLRKYNRKLALSNITTTYWVNPPGTFFESDSDGSATGVTPTTTQAFVYKNTAANYTYSDIYTDAADTDSDGTFNKLMQFYVSYLDQEGNESDLCKIYVDKIPDLALGASDKVNVAFVMGQGYVPYLTKVRLYKSSGSPRSYTCIAEVDVNQGYYLSDGNEAAIVGATTTRPVKDIKTSKAPGAVISSGVYKPFEWDPLSQEIISTEAEILAMNSVTGQLWIWTNKGTHLTNLSTTNPKGEEESEEVGCIGRFACTKVDKIVFFLSQSGLYFAEASGVRAFPGHVQNEILKYARETYADYPPLQNLRRASLGYLRRRKELWLYIPSSVDLGGTLPARLFIYKFFVDELENSSSIRDFVNYEFELLSTGNLDSTLQQTSQPLIFQEHSDHGMSISYIDSLVAPNNLVTMNPDTDAVAIWQGKTSLEFMMSAGKLNTVKFLREFSIGGDFDADIGIYTGTPNATGVPDRTGTYPRGLVNTSASLWSPTSVPPGIPSTIPPQGMGVKLSHAIGGSDWNRVGYSPLIRLTTQKASASRNTVRYKSLTIRYEELHDHE